MRPLPPTSFQPSISPALFFLSTRPLFLSSFARDLSALYLHLPHIILLNFTWAWDLINTTSSLQIQYLSWTFYSKTRFCQQRARVSSKRTSAPRSVSLMGFLWLRLSCSEDFRRSNFSSTGALKFWVSQEKFFRGDIPYLFRIILNGTRCMVNI